MGIFGNIMGKIFGHGKEEAAATPAPPSPPADRRGDTASAVVQPADATQSVDVGVVLNEMASMKGGGGNYQSSIVDLLKLLDLDSSLAARTELAEELGVHAGDHGSAEQNIALHKAVMTKLAENGGIVPDTLRN